MRSPRNQPFTRSVSRLYELGTAFSRALRVLAFLALAGAGLGGGARANPEAPAPGVRGLPFSRTYSLEDIGYVPRGSHLNFDAFGRIAVIHDGVYAVLNDTAWLNVIDADQAARVPMTEVVHAGYGRTYYGGRSTWGLAEFGLDGKLRAKPLVPANPPAWIRATTFDDVLVTADGVYFTGRNGFAFWDFARRESQMFEVRNSRTFAIGNRFFISAFGTGLHYFDLKDRSLRALPETGVERFVIERVTALDERRALIAAVDGRLFVFDGRTMTPWAGQAKNDLSGRISVLRHLADGNVAVAITGRGVFVVSPEGEVRSALTTPEFHQVSSIASREAGLLWVLTENSIEKVLYGGGLTSFGQRLGLPLGWPMVARWNDRLFVASDGVLYEALSSELNAPAHFERVPGQPSSVWSLAAHGRRLLLGNARGIYTMETDGTIQQVTEFRGLRYLAMVSETLCYAIGSREIALLEWQGERWTEPAPRIPGLENSFTVHRTDRSVWVEMGGDGVARITRRDGRIDLMTIPNAPQIKERWVNISVVGNVAMLSTHRGHRRFFDETKGDWCDLPELERLLDRSPRWLARAWKDESGTLWATHSEGVVRFTPKGGDYEMDLSTFDLINDRYPLVHVLPGNDVWISASRSLHHVERAASAESRPSTEPVLVSLVDSRSNLELLAKRFQDAPLRLPFAQNNLTFQFFSGSYAWRRAPTYEYRLNPQDPWATLDNGSLLRFANLREGNYHLQVRGAGDRLAPEKPLSFAFQILSPWHRTWPAYALYATLALGAVAGIARVSSRLARRRNRVLEKLVRERTGELETAMKKFNEETRIRATLAERDRLAGEIHDSVQQGLSGAILQLDTTLKLPAVNGDLRGRLDVARNMVSHAQQEVQHAVWDMDSPLLEANDLGQALRKLATFTAETQVPSVTVEGAPVPLPRFTTHHLLRIAQEATTNAVRHAAAQHIEIRLDYRPAAVTLTIADDGAGFTPDDALNKGGHFGLRGIRGRARKLGAELEITSAPGAGTRILIRVALPCVVPASRDEDHLRSH